MTHRPFLLKYESADNHRRALLIIPQGALKLRQVNLQRGVRGGDCPILPNVDTVRTPRGGSDTDGYGVLQNNRMNTG